MFLFADARGHPPRLAAVLLTSQGITYTDVEPSCELLHSFKQRNDKQIMGLEVLSVALGLCSFGDTLRGKHVRIYSDNTGAESAIQKGYHSALFNIVCSFIVRQESQKHLIMRACRTVFG